MSAPPPPYSTLDMSKQPPGAYPPPQGGLAPQPTGYTQPGTYSQPGGVGYSQPAPAGGYSQVPTAQYPAAAYQQPPGAYQQYGQPMAGQAQPQAYGQHHQTTVIMTQPAAQTVMVHRQGVNHVLHCIITFFFFPWIIVWIAMCLMDG